MAIIRGLGGLLIDLTVYSMGDNRDIGYSISEHWSSMGSVCMSHLNMTHDHTAETMMIMQYTGL